MSFGTSFGTSARTRVLAVAALTLALLVPAVSVPARTASAAPTGVHVDRAVVTPPAIPRNAPMGERCDVGGLNHPFCGLGTVEFTLSGFDTYGGVPVDDDLAYLSEGPTGTRMDFLVRCAGETRLRYRSVPVQVQAYLYPSSIGQYSRVDSDTAVVTAVFMPPSGLDLQACPEGGTYSLLAVLRSVSLTFEPTELGVERGLTGWTSRTWRPYPVPASA